MCRGINQVCGLNAKPEGDCRPRKSLGTGGQAVTLSDDVCAYLVAVIVRDLRLTVHFPELPEVQGVFSQGPLSRLALANVPFLDTFERLVRLDADSDVYFACLSGTA